MMVAKVIRGYTRWIVMWIACQATPVAADWSQEMSARAGSCIDALSQATVARLERASEARVRFCDKWKRTDMQCREDAVARWQVTLVLNACKERQVEWSQMRALVVACGHDWNEWIARLHLDDLRKTCE